MVTLQLSNLIDFVADVFGHADSSPEEARRIATYLTTANLTGHDSHGVIRVPVYIRWKKMGSVVPNQTAEVVVDTPSLAVVDGKFGYGQTVAPQAVKIGIEKCKASGLAAVALRNAGHIGRVGDWAEMAAAEGLVSIHFSASASVPKPVMCCTSPGKAGHLHPSWEGRKQRALRLLEDRRRAIECSPDRERPVCA